MPMKNAKEVFVFLLSNVRNDAARESAFYQEVSQQVQDTSIKEAVNAWLFLSEQGVLSASLHDLPAR